ncbi:MAG: winged helix-turn-helix domain-containing protein [Burkholderiales bacterium]
MSYLKFLNLAQAIRALPGFPAIDPVEEQLLNHLAVRWHSGDLVSVVETMNNLPDQSPSTVHRRLKTLRKKGFIAFKENEEDNRVKYIVATPLSNKYCKKMEECLVAALR